MTVIRILPAFLLLACAATERPAAPDADTARFVAARCDAVVPDDAATVQEAVDAVADGGRVCVRDGVWVGAIDVTDRDLTLVGESRAGTVLDGGGDRVVTAQHATLALVSLTVRGGSANSGGGLWVVGDSVATLDAVTVSDNHSNYNGGGLYVDRSTVTAEGSSFLRNDADGAGGGIYLTQGSFSGTEVRLVGNQAGAGGGGASAGRGTFVLAASEVLSNTAGDEGGGLALFTAGGPFVGTVIAGNTAVSTGGGVSANGFSGPEFENVVLAGNAAASGGAVSVDGEGVVCAFVNAAIVGNTAADTGGVLVTSETSSATFSHSDFWDNGADTNGVDPVGADGNLAVDPGFVAFTGRRPLRWDFRLEPASPLVDAGDPAIVDPDGTPSDVGAYAGPAQP